MASVSTTTPLSGSATFTSAVQALEDPRYTRIAGSVFADQAGTILIEQTPDGTNWDVSTSYSVTASDGKGFNEGLVGTQWRIRYTNGSVGQATFRLYAQARV